MKLILWVVLLPATILCQRNLRAGGRSSHLHRADQDQNVMGWRKTTCREEGKVYGLGRVSRWKYREGISQCF